MSREIARPFLKWAGGKGQLLKEFNCLYPDELKDGKIEVYIEPFVGGGAVLFDVLQNFSVKKAIIVDSNKELINCYRCIKENASLVISHLEDLKKAYSCNDLDKKKDVYLLVRERYNSIKLNGAFDYKKGAEFIFLNRTCFNGLYRVNNNGFFNVPFGKHKNPLLSDPNNLLMINRLLQKVSILHGDYSVCKEYINDKTFIYFDPPYRPITKTQSFVEYSSNGFNDDNQKELAIFAMNAKEKGAKILLSNSDPKNYNENDNFFDDLYKSFDIKRINAKRMINCQAEKRGSITEIIVRSYKNKEDCK